MNNKETILKSWKEFADEVAKIDQKNLLTTLKKRKEKAAAPNSLIRPKECYLNWCNARRKAIKECEQKLTKSGEYTKYLSASNEDTITA